MRGLRVRGGLREVSTRVPPRIPPRVPPGFHQVLQGCGVVRVRFHEGCTRVPPERCHRFLQSFTRMVLAGFHKQSVVRPPSEKPLEGSEDRFAHGRNTKQNQLQCVQHAFTVFTCPDNAARNVGFITRLTVLQGTCLTVLSITWWALGSKGSTRLRGPWGGFQKRSAKAMGQP